LIGVTVVECLCYPGEVVNPQYQDAYWERLCKTVLQDLYEALAVGQPCRLIPVLKGLEQAVQLIHRPAGIGHQCADLVGVAGGQLAPCPCFPYSRSAREVSRTASGDGSGTQSVMPVPAQRSQQRHANGREEGGPVLADFNAK
jgi:hypothetical protein